MSVRMLESKSVATFWYIPETDEFVGDERDYKDATYYGDYGQCDSDHYDIWSNVCRLHGIKRSQYDFYPRGRVMFNSKIHKFVVVCDKCIADNEEIRDRLVRWYNLPATTIFKTDDHYSCNNCR